MIKTTSQTSKSDDCSTNNYARQSSEFDEQCTSLKASTCEPAKEITSDDVSQRLRCKEDSMKDQKQAAKGPQTFTTTTSQCDLNTTILANPENG